MKPGQKRILWVSALLLVGLVALLVWRPWVPSEPVYQGKKLIVWLEQWRSSTIQVPTIQNDPVLKTPLEAKEEAQEAILQIGTNGIPFLLRLIRREESAITPWLKSTVPNSWHATLGLDQDKNINNETGAFGLDLLGTNASPAVPTLMELISQEMARNPSNPGRFWLVTMPLPSMRNAADPAIPLLIEGLTNANWVIRRDAALTLGRLRRKPEIVVPALVKFLRLQNQPDRIGEEETITYMGMFGTNAASAASALTGYLTDPDPKFREAATNSLRRVDPSAAERAGIRIFKTR